MKAYTYLLLNLATILFPLLFSFESKISYYKRWKYLFPAIIIPAMIFILWDYYFTGREIWRFNSDYITGYYVLSLPIEEWMFFAAIPFSCVFIYDALNYYIPKNHFEKHAVKTGYAFAVLFIFIAIVFREKLYTTACFGLAGISLIIHLILYKNKYIGRFFLAYLVHLIPFFIVNGFLTALPVVIYNNHETLGLRIGTIPLEDTIYSMTLLLANITIYETLKNRKQNSLNTWRYI